MNFVESLVKFFDRTPAEPSEINIERVQRAMLIALERDCEAVDKLLDRRISTANNLDDLWYLRPNLMSAISFHKGESVAQAVLADITHLFERPQHSTGLARR